jgi:transposase
MKRHLGVDLHPNNFTVYSFKENEPTTAKHWPLRALARFVETLTPEDELAVEATSNTRFFWEQIRAKVARVVVVNTAQFEVIRRSVCKTDDRDSAALGLFLFKNMLPEVRMKDKLSAQVSSLVNTRDKLVKLRTVLKNKLHAIAIASGQQLVRECFTSEVGLKKMLAMNLDAGAKIEVKVIVTQIRSLNGGVERLENEIIEQGRGLEGYENITSIKGIGGLSGSVLLSVIGNVNDFKQADQLASYFGIVPIVRNSNDKNHSGRITKHGSKIGRTTLVQCTLVAIRYSPYLRSFYDRIRIRRNSPGKAIIATANKLLRIIYNTLKHKWVFEDFGKYVLAEQKSA